jgi:hypothetical protein
MPRAGGRRISGKVTRREVPAQVKPGRRAARLIVFGAHIDIFKRRVRHQVLGCDTLPVEE